jgi:chemotaxis protein MotB
MKTMYNKHFFSVVITGMALLMLTASSCVVSKQKYLDSQIALRTLKNDSARMANEYALLTKKSAALQADISLLEERKKQLNAELEKASTDAQQKGNALQKSQSQIAEQQKKLAQLQALLDAQKAAVNDLKNKMSSALKGFSASDLTVTQKKGKVYVSLSENLLFPSGSADVNENGKKALLKLAEVLNANPEITVNIEGHTDSIPMRGAKFVDNWGLSVGRATSIVRILVNEYKVDATRVVASGHSEYDPKDSNNTAEGRARNRRTEIILSPKLDELYKILSNE